MTSDEAKLSRELRGLCAPKGVHWKEKEPKESAKILHRLGCLYLKKCAEERSDSFDIKLQYIQSSALFNSALVRNPLEADLIKNDLQNLCSDLLRKARATLQDFDLIGFSEKLKQKLENWRNQIKEQTSALQTISEDLNELKSKQMEQQKISDVENLQDEITTQYKHFMREVSQQCIEILGELPCDYALVGMGSMASKNITPYSDFENFVLLQDGVEDEELYRAMLEYFRWYAVIFQVILINLGETILPCVAIPFLNNYAIEDGNWFYDVYTKRGICFDGMIPYACKSPLGRQPTRNKPWQVELIKPVSLMAEYLTQEQDLKNGYHLAEMLSNTCFVDGSQDVYQAFENVRQKILENKQSSSRQEVFDMIKDDVQRYSTKNGISSAIVDKTYNVKRFVYRSTTVCISGFAKLHGIKPGSSFDLVRELRKNDVITEEFCHRLQYAVALVCEIRLKTYLEHGYQCDWIDSASNGRNEDVSMTLINAVGKRSCYDFLEIVCCIQCDAVSCCGLNDPYLFYHPVAIYIAICLFLRMRNRIIEAIDFIENNPILQFQSETSGVLCKPQAVEHCGGRIGEDEISKNYLGSSYSRMQLFNHQFTKRAFPNSTVLSSDCSNSSCKNIVNILNEVVRQLSEKQAGVEALYFSKIAQKLF